MCFRHTERTTLNFHRQNFCVTCKLQKANFTPNLDLLNFYYIFFFKTTKNRKRRVFRNFILFFFSITNILGRILALFSPFGVSMLFGPLQKDQSMRNSAKKKKNQKCSVCQNFRFFVLFTNP